jgi:hypothetical protein
MGCFIHGWDLLQPVIVMVSRAMSGRWSGEKLKTPWTARPHGRFEKLEKFCGSDHQV